MKITNNFFLLVFLLVPVLLITGPALPDISITLCALFFLFNFIILKKDYNFLNGVDVLIHEAIIEEISTEVSQSAYRLGNDRIGEIFKDINDYHANLIDYDNNPGLLSRLEEIDLGILALIHIIPDKDNIIVKRELKRFKSKSKHNVVVADINMEIQLPLNSKEIIVK